MSKGYSIVRTNFLKAMEKQLLKMKEELLLSVDEDVKAESDTSKFEIGDIYDQASSDRDRELSLILGDRDREKLREIDNALQRIEDGLYGICEECEEPIGEGRLKVMPFARVCVDCKALDERDRGARKRYEEQEIIGGADLTDFEEEE